MSITIVGFSSSDKVPGAYRETLYGQGRVSIGSMPLKLLITGTKTSAGSATADADVVQLISEDDADARLGAGSEGACQAYAALENSDITLYAAPVAEAGGAAAGTLTVTFGGTRSTEGTARVYLMGKEFAPSIGAGDSNDDIATALADLINADARMFATAAATGSSTGACVITTKSKGVRQKDWYAAKDDKDLPAGTTCALTGGSATTSGLVPFTTGSGADDVTNVLALLTSDTYDYIALAQYDSTNLGKVKTQLDSEDNPGISHLEHAMVGQNAAMSTATTLAASTINHARIAVVWMQYCEWTPAMMAANVHALRSSVEGSNPNYNYDDVKLTGIPPQRYKADVGGHSTFVSCLNSGVTPLRTNPDATVAIVRGIVSHCKNGSAYDYRTLDWGDAVVPDRISKELDAQWAVFKAANPYSGADPASDERPAPSGVGTPSLWNADATKVMRDAERSLWVQDVSSNLPQSEWSTVQNCILSAVPVVVRKQNHQIGISVRQQAA